jgi:hypothetical protein
MRKWTLKDRLKYGWRDPAKMVYANRPKRNATLWLVALGTVSLLTLGLKWTLFLGVGALIVIVCIVLLAGRT